MCVEGGWATAFASRRCNTLHGSGTKTSSDHQSKFVIDKRQTFSGLCGLLSRKGKRVALKKFSFENVFSPTMSYFEFHFFLICTMLLCCPFVLFAVSVLFPFVRSVCFLFPFFLSRSVSPFICVFCPCSLACSYVWYVQKRYFSRYSNWFHMRFWLNMIELFIEHDKTLSRRNSVQLVSLVVTVSVWGWSSSAPSAAIHAATWAS